MQQLKQLGAIAPTTTDVLDTVVVGAGQAGLGTSYFLRRDLRSHVVFERGRIGESWLSQRWDSFQLNTPNAFSTLPGFPYDGVEPDGFWRSDELVDYFRRYVEALRLPVRSGTAVLSVERDEEAGYFVIATRTKGMPAGRVLSRSVVIASGMQNLPKIPSIEARIPGSIVQMHAAAYHNAESLPGGAVVVVGSAQSGVQIVEDLLAAGRKVFLCTSKVGRVPRRYRGGDNAEWSIATKFWDVKLDSMKAKSAGLGTQPQVSGVGRRGHTVSLQSLARQGAVILGRLMDVDGHTLVLGDDAAANVRFADEFSQRRKADIDTYLSTTGVPLPPIEDDPADAPDLTAECASPERRLNLRDAQVSAIIWATGFTANFDWVRLPILDGAGMPVHERGVSPVPGIYFVGLPWLYKRKSGFIYGIAEDAQYIANVIARQLNNNAGTITTSTM